MELALSLGENTTTKPPFSSSAAATFLDKPPPQKLAIDLGFCMGNVVKSPEDNNQEERRSGSSPPVQLDLLPFSPVIQSQTSTAAAPNQLMSFSWLTQNLTVATEPGFSAGRGRGKVEVNRTSSSSSPNSTNSAASSFQMDLLTYRNGSRSSNSTSSNKRDYMELQNSTSTLMELQNGNDRGARDSSSRGGAISDDQEDENGLTAAARKKLRLTKDQSAFLEESFKEHNTLNPKQKLALAKQLNLRPRQVEVWFQNRRARTKLKQTEVDCEHLKRCCEKLTEENRRLQKELQELRALKSNSHPFYSQLPPPTTLTMCPSCERVTTTTAAAAGGNASPEAEACTANTTLCLAKPRDQLLLPFPTSKLHQQTNAAAS